MKLALATLGVCGAFLCTQQAHAADNKLRIGFGADVGVPSGVALGVVVHPLLDWAPVEASLTYNGLAFGGRFSLQLDPMALAKNLPIGIFVDAQAGFAGAGTVPGHEADLPELAYDYVNLYGGLRFGKPNGFHWSVELGPSYVHATTGNFQAILQHNNVNSLTVGNPTVDGWVLPTFVTGFAVVWP